MIAVDTYSQPVQGISKEALIDECLDLNIPAKRYDSTEVLQKHLQAAYDETNPVKGIFRDPELEKSNIYIGKVSLFNKLKLRKYIPFL